jgi:molybdenum cofactor biosynthesis enzyme
MQRTVYDFEELAEDDLYRPSLAALRALRCGGVLVSRAGWLAAPADVRMELARVGASDVVDTEHVKSLVAQIPLRELKLYPRWEDPPADKVPDCLLQAMANARPLPVTFWRSLRPFDRHVLLMLSNNTRLLWRALDELARWSERGAEVMTRRPWQGLLGRCELELPLQLATRLASPDFMDGRAFVLARVAGVRAARRTSDLLDLQAGTGTGPIELGCHTGWQGETANVLWQAHVSSAQGEFFPAASILAATTAAVALFDMLGGQDPGLGMSIRAVGVHEERWIMSGDEEVTIAR